MKTWYWEGEQIFIINRDLQQLIDDKVVKTVVSFNLVAMEDKHGHMVKYSAILIYK